MTELECRNNNLTGTLNASAAAGLTLLHCNDNELTELILGSQNSLKNLHCENNALETLDVSGAANLEWLYCQNNNLHTLTLGVHSKLSQLDCSNNALGTLDISAGLPALANLECAGVSTLIMTDRSLALAANPPAGGKFTTTQVNVNNGEVSMRFIAQVAEGYSFNGWEHEGFPPNTFELDGGPDTGLFVVPTGTLSLTANFVQQATISITQQPAASTTLTAGSISGSLSVAATLSPPGEELSYKWVYTSHAAPGTPQAAPGGNAATLNIPTGLAAGTYVFHCEVSAPGADTVTSDPATVTVEPALDYGPYNADDIAVINAIIEANSLTTLTKWENGETTPPQDWATYVVWSSDAVKRIEELDFFGEIFTSTVLDVSGLDALKVLDCSYSSLTELNVTGLNALSTLTCSGFEGPTLDVSGLAALETLACEWSNLYTLDVSGCSALTSLDSSYSTLLTSLDITGCTALVNINVSHSKLQTLDVSGFTMLNTLDCSYNTLLTSLDITGCTALVNIYVSWSKLQTLDVSGFTMLDTLDCSYNILLTSLDVTGCSALEILTCYRTAITSLDVTGCSALEKLTCYSTAITSLDVTGCSALEILTCYSTAITALDVSGLAELTSLNCSSSSLQTLDVSGCAALKTLICENNKLTDLNLSSLSNISELLCGSNPLTHLALLDGCELTTQAAPNAGGTACIAGASVAAGGAVYVDLAAAASAGYAFFNWTGTGAGVPAQNAAAAWNNLTLPKNPVTLTANFFEWPPSYSLSISSSGLYDFGRVAQGYTPPEPLSVTVSNTGTKPTGPLQMVIEGTEADSYTVSATSIPSIGVGDTFVFTVQPKPGLALRTHYANIRILSAQPDTGLDPLQLFGLQFTVAAEVTQPLYEISTGHNWLNFSAGLFGNAAPAPRSVTIRNTGTQPTGDLTITARTGGEKFTFSPAGISSLAPGESASFSVQPKNGLPVGSHSDSLYIVPAEGNGNPIERLLVTAQYVVVREAFGIEVEFAEPDFGVVGFGYTQPPDHNVLIHNTGAYATAPFTIALSGPNADAFILRDASVIPSIKEHYVAQRGVRPKAGLPVGVYTADLTIAPAAENPYPFGTHTIAIKFTVEEPVYALTLTPPDNKTFTTVTQGAAPPAAHSVSISNTGNIRTGALSITLSGPGADGFTLSKTLQASLETGASASFTVQPKAGLAPGTHTATITVGPAAGNPNAAAFTSQSFTVTFKVEALVYALTLNPSANKTFTTVTQGVAVPAAHSVSIQNSGNVPTGALGIALGGANPGSFTLSKTLQASLETGASASFTVQPKAGLAQGSYTATVTVGPFTTNPNPLTAISFTVSFTVNAPNYNITVTPPSGYTSTRAFLDGKEYKGKLQSSRLTLTAPGAGAKTLTLYRFDSSGVPVGMYVYTLAYSNGAYKATAVPELRDLLTYHGFSIRLTGRTGIRFKTGIATGTRASLLSSGGLAGYRLKEYGTLVMNGANYPGLPLVLGGDKTDSGVAYGMVSGQRMDAIFETVGGRYRFTSVLVGLPPAQYKTQFMFRGYIILTKNGQDITLYGPPVAKSIYSIAQQLLASGQYARGSSPDVFLRKLIADAG